MKYQNEKCRIVMTGDGSSTLYLEDYHEHMHSLSGAYEEAVLKHVGPSGILDVRSDRMQVLDVGFGLGYNVLALIAGCRQKKYSGSITVVSLEKEKFFLSAMKQISFNDERDAIYRLIIDAYAGGTAREGAVEIRVVFGDARKSLKGLGDMEFDAIFFDPFSPSKNPELWSVEFFRSLHAMLKSTGVLTTYSSALQIRTALLEAGFIIGRGPAAGGKREGTLAVKNEIIAPLSGAEIRALRGDCRSVPYRDCSLDGSPAMIRRRRSEEIKKRKALLRASLNGEGEPF